MDVIVMETAASDIMCPIRSGTDNLTEVRRHAANITNVSSIPIPLLDDEDEKIKHDKLQIFHHLLLFVIFLKF